VLSFAFLVSCFDSFEIGKQLATKTVGITENFESRSALRYPSRALFFQVGIKDSLQQAHA
jgi:hypothetical protein